MFLRHAFPLLHVPIAVLLAFLFQATDASAREQAPGFYRFAVGRIEVTALYDGAVALYPSKLLTNTSQARISELLAGSFGREPLATSVNVFLVKTATKLVMIDTGGGALFGDECGHLLANLKAAGYGPEQVDEIYLTHLHRDHVGGLIADGAAERAFPNAIVRVDEREARYWLNPHGAEAAPEMRHHFEGAASSLKPYLDAGKLKPFGDDPVLAPGIKAVSSRGHTPGHTFYVIESKGAKLVLWGDLVHVSAVQFPQPSVSIRFDADQGAAAKQRISAFADAARGKFLVGGAHIPFPGVGRLRTEGSGFVFVPVDYSTDPK